MDKSIYVNAMTHLEKFLGGLDKKLTNTDLSRKDILIYAVYPLHMIGMDSQVFFHEKEDDYVPRGTVDFAGRYEGMDKRVHIDIIYHPEDTVYNWNEWLWAYIRGIYFDTLSHEIMHIYQNEKREAVGIADHQRLVTHKEYKCIANQDEDENGLYLINPDEVEAYAYNLASQLFRRYRSYEGALHALRKQHFNNIETVVYYSKFIKANSYIHKRLMKKTVHYLTLKYGDTVDKPEMVRSQVIQNK